MQKDGFCKYVTMRQSTFDAFKPYLRPVKWVGNTLPDVVSKSGRVYTWESEVYTEKPLIGANKYVILKRKDEKNRIIMAIDSMKWVFMVSPGHFGLRYYENGIIKISCFDPDLLEEFSRAELIPYNDEFVVLFPHGFLAHGDPVSVVELDINLKEGCHNLEVIYPLNQMTEILILGRSDYQSMIFSEYTNPDYPLQTIFSINPNKNEVQVMPQKWLTGKRFDDGRHSHPQILRVLRNPDNGHIVGDGIRLGPFELEEDGCNIRHWFTEPVGHKKWPAPGPDTHVEICDM